MKRSVLLLAAGIACAQNTPWTPDDIVNMESIGDMQISPDGRRALWTKSRMDAQKGETASNLWMRDLASGEEYALTRGSDRNTSPRFSPDGKHIAFLSTRKSPGAQLWLMRAGGGEAWQPAPTTRGVQAIEWIDGGALLLVMPEDAPWTERRARERGDDTVVVDDEGASPPVRLYRLDVRSGAVKRLTENADRIERVAVAPGGKLAVAVHARSLRFRYDQKVKPITVLHDLATGAATRLWPEQAWVPGQMAWDIEGKGFYFSAPYSTHPVYTVTRVERLYYYDLAVRRAVEVNLGWERGLGFGIAPVPGGLLALLADGVYAKPALYKRTDEGWTRAWIESPHARNTFGAVASRDGRTLLFLHSTSGSPAQWYAADLAGASVSGPRPIAAANEGLKRKPLAKTEIVRWKGARDEEVEGILYYPHGYVPGRRYPLVAIIHGGPDHLDTDEFAERPLSPSNLIAQRGAFVLKANYHGSTHYGLPWAESIAAGNYNELEWIDVEKGVDFAIAKGLADPARLGVWGWSNGSIVAIELTTRTTRYAAAVTGAGDVNWITDWSNCDYGHAFGEYYLGKVPFEDPAFHLRKSALFRLDKVRTPTLIMFGAEDRSVPAEQGWEHFRTLQHWAKADVKFVLFPGEGHSPTKKLAHRRRVLEEQLAWLDKYLFRTAETGNVSLKPGSPLAGVLKRQALGRNPEMVRRGRLEIGRFEVTREQYAAFDPAYRYEPGTAHYPATGVSFEDAKRYCAWLAKTTGLPFRLPSEDDVEALLKPAAGGNTLDYWAGYAVGPDDYARLARAVAELPPDALLRPVGAAGGAGEDPIYDLGGNAAEWALAKDGTGRALGGCAALPGDAKSSRTPPAAFVGFRVVR